MKEKAFMSLKKLKWWKIKDGKGKGIDKTMLSFCLKCRKNTRNINPKTSGASNGRKMILSNCAISGSKKPMFIKNRKQMDNWVVKN